MRLVRRFEAGHFFGSQRQLGGGDCVFDVMGFRRADNRGCDIRLRELPGECDLGGGQAAFGGDGLQRVDDAAVGGFR